MNLPNELKILSIGNSFSVDTMKHLAEIAHALGIEHVKLGNLYVGGCSLNKHFEHAMNDLPAYKYYTNDGSGWIETPDVRIREAIVSEEWDWISIQHGTKDGSRYTDPASYEKLPALIEYVRSLAWSGARIAFNMTWVGEPWHHHHEIVSYGGDQLLIYRKITEITESIVEKTAGLDRVSPTGTAVQNARTTCLKDTLSRDGYHLSLDTGRYIAGLTFLKALTDIPIDGIEWAPDGTDVTARRIAVEAANAAIRTPYSITDLSV